MIPVWLLSQFQGLLGFLKGKWLLPLVVVLALLLYGLWAKGCGYQDGFTDGEAKGDVEATRWRVKYELLLAAKTTTTTTTSRTEITVPTIKIKGKGKTEVTPEIQAQIDSAAGAAQENGYRRGLGAYQALKEEYDRIAPPLRVDEQINAVKIWGWFRPLFRDYDLSVEPPPRVIDSVKTDARTIYTPERTFWEQFFEYIKWCLAAVGVGYLLDLLVSVVA